MENPEITANFLSRGTLWWLQKLLRLGWKSPIQTDDLHKLIPSRRAEQLQAEFEKEWSKAWEWTLELLVFLVVNLQN